MAGRFARLLWMMRTMLMCLLLLVLVPSGATAYQLVVTFDNGDYDPNMPDLGGDLHGPYDWVEENGVRAAGFWAVGVGNPDSYFQQGHTHIQQNFSGREDGRSYRHHAWTGDVQGLIFSLEGGESFDVVSIDYALDLREDLNDPYLQRVNWAWSAQDAQMLLSLSFDPTLEDFSSQWTPFAVDDFGTQFVQWYTEPITGFDNITSFYWTSTAANLEIDTIVLEVHGVLVPEPSTGLLAGLGLAGILAAGDRRARS